MSEKISIFKKQSVWEPANVFSGATPSKQPTLSQNAPKMIWNNDVNQFSSQLAPISTKSGFSSAMNLSTPLRSIPPQSRGTEPFRPLQDESTYDMTINETLLSDIPESAESTIASLKLQVESLVTAIMMGNSSSANALAGADALEISHRIMTRMQLLKDENTRLAQLANGKHAANLEATNAHLRQENEALKEQLAELQAQRQTVGEQKGY